MSVDNQKYVVSWSLTIKQSPLQINEWQTFNSLDKAKKKYTARERARAGDKSKQLTDRGAKFKLARKMGKKTFTHDGKTYSTLLKGEKPDKIMPELSGKTSKKIKKFIG